MTAKIDTLVLSTPPSFGVDPKPSSPENEQKKAFEQEKRALEMEARLLRWKEIQEAGGIDSWIVKQLKAKNLSTDHLDPAKLSDKERKRFKEKKKAEAEERRKLRRSAWKAYQATHISHLGSAVYWNDDDDADKFDINHREDRAQSNSLPEFKNPQELAKALGLTISRLRWLSFHRDVDTGSHYRTWTIPKRDGSPRTITAPKKDLKATQRWILRKVAEKLPVHYAAHGFLSNRSIVSNAKVHAGADTLVKVDIKDFFPSVTWKRVKGLLRKAGLSEQMATLMSLLATESPREIVEFRSNTYYVAKGPRSLPQGAPTSPAITNAICLRLDRRMSALAKTFEFRYTRYADDLAFSWYRPKRVKAKTYPRAPVGALLHGIKQILRSEGFEINPKKTRVLRKGSRQKLTGLIINQAPEGTPEARVPRDVVRRLRAAIHNRKKGKPGKEGETLDQLKGMAAFIYMTDPEKGRKFLEQIASLEEQNTTKEATE